MIIIDKHKYFVLQQNQRTTTVWQMSVSVVSRNILYTQYLSLHFHSYTTRYSMVITAVTDTKRDPCPSEPEADIMPNRNSTPSPVDGYGRSFARWVCFLILVSYNRTTDHFSGDVCVCPSVYLVVILNEWFH